MVITVGDDKFLRHCCVAHNGEVRYHEMRSLVITKYILCDAIHAVCQINIHKMLYVI